MPSVPSPVKAALLAVVGSLSLGASLGVSSAAASVAPVSTTSITTPANNSFFQQDTDDLGAPAYQMAVTGTSDGTTGDLVDIVCLGENNSPTSVASSVAVQSDGTFSWTGSPPNPESPCNLRAIPSGSTPSTWTPYTGPEVALGDFNSSQVTDTGTANDGQTFDFWDNAAQSSGDADYLSVGSGGLYDSYYIDPTSLHIYADLFYANDYISDSNTDRFDLLIDGVPAYDADNAELTAAGNPGLPALTWTTAQDPVTGDLTIQESEQLVNCSPDAATWPITGSSCTSFVPSGVTFDRTIVQGADGDQAHITDTYTSTDGQAHTLNVRYGQDFETADAGFNAPWTDGTTYSTHTAGDTIPVAPTALASMYMNYDNTLGDGDPGNAFGALTFTDVPDAIAFVPNGKVGATHFLVTYTRTIPAAGSATLREAFSWGPTNAFAHALAASAEQSFTAPGATTGSASGIDAGSATLDGSVDPNQQDTTYHFDYGTTTAYGAATADADAGSGSSNVDETAAPSGLAPDTNYHFRVVATNGSGTTDGLDQTFTTAAAPSPPATAAAPPPAATTSSSGLAVQVMPVITGTPVLGDTLTASSGQWQGTGLAYSYSWLRDGVLIPGATGDTYKLTQADVGHHISVEVVASAGSGSASASASATSASVSVQPTPAQACANPSGRLHQATLGPISLGMTRAQSHDRLAQFSPLNAYTDNLCLNGGYGIRVGYGDRAMMPRRAHDSRLMGRVVLALTANPHYALGQARPGDRVASVAGPMHFGRAIHLGLNTWYVTHTHGVTGVVKARNGRILEVGIANHQLAGTRRGQITLLLYF